MAAPELGFMFPSFDDRAANIYNALFYSKNTEEIHQDFIDAVFRTQVPMSAGHQREAFHEALSQALEKEKASLEAELETEIGKIDKDTGYDPKSPVVPGRIAVTDSTGNDETHPMYYQLLQADTLLSEAKLRAILHGDGTQPGLGRLEPKPAEEEGKPSISTYVVLVTRDKDMIGGLPESQGYLLVETYVPAVVDENGIEVTTAPRRELQVYIF